MRQSLRLFSIIFIILISQTVCLSQEQEKIDGEIPINPDVFNAQLLSDLIFQKINLSRVENAIGVLEFDSILYYAAFDQATYMAQKMRAGVVNEDKKNKTTTGDRVKYYGGTQNATEIIKDMGVKKGKTVLTYEELAEKIVEKWEKSKNTRLTINSSKFVFIGVASAIDTKGKAYVSAVFGDYSTLNPGAELRKDLKVPFTKIPKWKFWAKLFPYNDKVCMNIDKLKDPYNYHKGLSVKDNQIFYDYDDLKGFQKLFPNKKDGLAVEIVQKAQFPCNKPNIIDYNLPYRGYLTKTVYSNKLWKSNIKQAKKEFNQNKKASPNKEDKKKKFNTEEFLKENRLHVCLTPKMPKIPGQYDLNLVMITNKHICRIIKRSYLDMQDVEFTFNLDFIKDTVSYKTLTPYIPKADTTTLSFKIPFEQNKFEYDSTDILPLLKSLNEPDFFTDSIRIIAHSSLEGSEDVNKFLQEKRAQSIIDVLKQEENEDRRDSIPSKIQTDDGWVLFKRDVTGTEFDTLGKLEKEQAKALILKNNLLQKLEPTLAKHRFAQANLKVTYNIAGDKEMPYVISRFNKAIAEKKDPRYILSMQEYVFHQIEQKKYAPKALDKLFIPQQKEYSFLLMNQLMFEKEMKGGLNIDANFCQKLQNLSKLDSTNVYNTYNKLCCYVKYGELGAYKDISKTQNAIQALYKTKLNKAEVDVLNLKYQFRIIDELDTAQQGDDNPIIIAATERIKKILKIDENDWQSVLKLANTVAKQQNDFNYAVKILEPLVLKENPSEELLFTYISLCSFFPEMFYSDAFAQAMEKASTKNPERFCKLFDGSKQSIQVFENTKVKSSYCKTCQ